MNTALKTDKSEIHSDFYNFKMPLLDGTEVDFSKLKGKKVLLVNVASECGYTPQYKELQQLHEQYKDKVQVLGFPANNFGGQEPGSSDQIAEFCEKNYGVTFPVFEKISVKGDDQHPLYKWLSEQAGQEPTWNFNKYLLDE
ncbi:MAG: glutathione peroxidase, partial [Hymenobacteraceae bacterium]|nr:glutathione peroxidase [Hymenobacteraceae bacterium]MDX5395814.1 glutathione peroxidase [Hymenobacteraceae bacterium]MDX5511869.1 glutathione peroxidase [Hymenobacteraceae bacterium]